jgi:hypothetical protein
LMIVLAFRSLSRQRFTSTSAYHPRIFSSSFLLVHPETVISEVGKRVIDYSEMYGWKGKNN